MYDANLIAKYIVNRCSDTNKPISNLKLQKILYFVQAGFLVNKGKPCFNNEIKAWDYGPVAPDVYHEYKMYGSANIPKSENIGGFSVISKEDRAQLDSIIDKTAKYSASTLVEITHRQSPWKQAHQRGNETIYPEVIKEYFEN